MNQLHVFTAAVIPGKPAVFILVSIVTITTVVLLVRVIRSSNNEGNTLKQIKRQRAEYIKANKKRKSNNG